MNTAPEVLGEEAASCNVLFGLNLVRPGVGLAVVDPQHFAGPDRAYVSSEVEGVGVIVEETHQELA